MIDRKKFFDGIRQGPFSGKLTPATVKGCSAILDAWEQSGLTDLRYLAYMLATAMGEVGQNMLPVREGFKETDAQARAYVRRKNYKYAKEINGNVYYGRGLVQLTWDYNYDKMGKLLKVPLLAKPDLALDPLIAAQIMFTGMTKGSFTGKKLADFFNDKKTDWVWARSIINGKRKGEPLPDRAQEIANYAKAFYADLINASVTTGINP